MENLFIIIGAMKSGTSSLYHNLRNHPDIVMSHYKETNFFSRDFKKGADWYRQCFREEGKVFGDVSPSYSQHHTYPETVRNLRSVTSGAKIIYIVRDPIERIISHLHHDLYRDRLRLADLEETIFSNPNYLLTSRYHYQLIPYLDSYPADAILILDFEELRTGTSDVLASICRFLHVDMMEVPPETKAYNTSEKKYWVKNHDYVCSRLSPKMAKLYRYFFYLINKKIERPVLPDELKRKMKDSLYKDVEEFRKTTGIGHKWRMYDHL